MKYYLYRIQKEDYDEFLDYEKIKIDYLPIISEADDKFIAFISKDLKVIGAYKKVGDLLVRIKKIEVKKEINLRSFYGKLSIVTEVGDRTYKVFAKKAKEISKEDYELITSFFQVV